MTTHAAYGPVEVTEWTRVYALPPVWIVVEDIAARSTAATVTRNDDDNDDGAAVTTTRCRRLQATA